MGAQLPEWLVSLHLYVWHRPVYLCDLGVFGMPTFSAYENRKKKRIINISRYVMRFVCFPFWNMPSAGFSMAHKYVSLCTDVSLCHKYVPLCAVLPVSVLRFV